MIQIFDSLAHPTISGGWLGSSLRADFELLADELQQAHFIGACAVGLAGIEDYAHHRFIESCRRHPNLIPIAGFDPSRESLESLRDLIQLGFRGIKIHPRFSRLTQDLESIVPALQAAGRADMTVFLCTYMHCNLGNYPARDSFNSIVDLLREAPKTRVILVHGGDVDLLRFAELVRFNENLLLDLSMTMMKYAGSSIDDDIAFLFHQFDRRICIGTDWPEYRPQQVRERFEHFASDLAIDKQQNIASRNLLAFLGATNDPSRT